MTIAKQVENILRFSKDARNSDVMLQIIYMQKAGMELTAKQIDRFKDLPSMETIRRIRQKIQEQGRYEAEAPVKRERSHKAMIMQQTAPLLKGEKAVEHVEKTLGIKVHPWPDTQRRLP